MVGQSGGLLHQPATERGFGLHGHRRAGLRQPPAKRWRTDLGQLGMLD